MKRPPSTIEGRMASIEKLLDEILAIVSSHTRRFDRIDERLKKLDVLDQIKITMDALAVDLKPS